MFQAIYVTKSHSFGLPKVKNSVDERETLTKMRVGNIEKGKTGFIMREHCR